LVSFEFSSTTHTKHRFTMPKDCTGLSASKYGTDNYYIRPRNQPIGTFLNNVAHSSTTTGLMIDDMELSDGKYSQIR